MDVPTLKTDDRVSIAGGPPLRILTVAPVAVPAEQRTDNTAQTQEWYEIQADRLDTGKRKQFTVSAHAPVEAVDGIE